MLPQQTGGLGPILANDCVDDSAMGAVNPFQLNDVVAQAPDCERIEQDTAVADRLHQPRVAREAEGEGRDTVDRWLRSVAFVRR